MLEGTAIGTITDINGNFSLEVPANEMSTLQFSMIGYSTEDYEVTGTNSVSVAMIQDLVALDEVVVIGYGSTKKIGINGSCFQCHYGRACIGCPFDYSRQASMGV
jgi:hypothetical protein